MNIEAGPRIGRNFHECTAFESSRCRTGLHRAPGKERPGHFVGSEGGAEDPGLLGHTGHRWTSRPGRRQSAWRSFHKQRTVQHLHAPRDYGDRRRRRG